MIRSSAFALILSFTLAVPAFALRPESCSERLMAQGTPSELRDAYTKLRKLGLRALLAELDQGDVSVSVRKQWLPWHQTVSARVGWTGRKQLVIRGDIDVATRENKEKFLWDVAISLFQLQMQPWLWSKSAILPRAETPGAEALTVNPLEYLARQMPSEWRDQYLTRARTLLGELYIVFLSFRELKAEDLMPARDPGRHWLLHAMVMSDGSHSIGPNVEDFETLKRNGIAKVEQNVTERNSRSVLFNYYMAHLKRAMIITSTVSTLLLVPQVATYHETQAQISVSEQKLDSAMERARETEMRTLQHRSQREIKRLSEAIKAEQGKESPDEERLTELKTQLQIQLDRSPGGLYALPRE